MAKGDKTKLLWANPEYREHMSKVHKKVRVLLKGERHPSWKGGLPKCLDCDKQLGKYKALRCRPCMGISKRLKITKKDERHTAMARREYILWRTAVFMRDDYICTSCGDEGVYLEADHIKPWALYPELRYAIDNGRTLCKPCHQQTETYPINLRGRIAN